MLYPPLGPFGSPDAPWAHLRFMFPAIFWWEMMVLISCDPKSWQVVVTPDTGTHDD